jgi:hypothetical protein
VDLDNLAVYYTASGDSLVVTLSRSVLARALDRQIARRTAKAEGKPLPSFGPPWLGTNMGLQVELRLAELAARTGQDEYQSAMQARAWGNLPILNEWKRRYPGQDPIVVHQRFWQTRLVCPGGGKYVWNDRWQTFESTVFGHPGEPKQGPAVPPALGAFARGNFGLSFENHVTKAPADPHQCRPSLRGKMLRRPPTGN